MYLVSLYDTSNQTLIPHTPTCWVLLYLGANNAWKRKATAEVQNLISACTDTSSSDQRLSMIPMSAWEDEMPVIENIICETLRIINNSTFLRRNLADNVYVGDKLSIKAHSWLIILWETFI
jgi:sterol 14-demethylase